MTERAPSLHPEAREILDRLDGPPPHATSVAESRAAFRDAFASLAAPDADVAVADRSIPGPGGDPEVALPVRTYAPPGEDHPVLVFLHGGGWVRGDLDTHDGLCRLLADAADCLVVSVDYRRPPEHRFPAAVRDAYAATAWAAEHAAVVGGDPHRVAVGGDSAGGTLAAATTLLARERGGPELAHQALFYPVTDRAFDSDSFVENGDYPPPRPTMRWFWDRYLDDEMDGLHPCASPLRARDLSGLPPATVVTAGYDPLCDDGAAYADRLDAAGVPVTHAHYPGMVHVFASFPDLDRARDARRRVAADLRASFESR